MIGTVHPFRVAQHHIDSSPVSEQDPRFLPQPCAGYCQSQEESVKYNHLTLITALTAMSLAFSLPALAQRGHGGGPPAGHGPGMANSNGNSANKGDAMSHTDMSHASPSTVLSHNTAIARKIKTLTGEDAATACNGFKNLGQCVAAAHVAKNLNIPGGFDALKAKVTGTGAMSLGKAIESFEPGAHAKSEVKKANKQASDDMKEAETDS
jgi:hypothetical protein